MRFEPFEVADFRLMTGADDPSPPADLVRKIEALRTTLGDFPEFRLEFFRNRIVRRPTMRGRDGLVFGSPHWEEGHWFLYNVGGDQDQIQLNIGMFASHLRVGLGFMIGRQVVPKIPAFHLLQTFLGTRPPIPFRDALLRCIRGNDFRLEVCGKVEDLNDADAVIRRLETLPVPADDSALFVFLGSIWDPRVASTKLSADYRRVFLELMPFYEELILAGGRYRFVADDDKELIKGSV